MPGYIVRSHYNIKVVPDPNYLQRPLHRLAVPAGAYRHRQSAVVFFYQCNNRLNRGDVMLNLIKLLHLHLQNLFRRNHSPLAVNLYHLPGYLPARCAGMGLEKFSLHSNPEPRACLLPCPEMPWHGIGEGSVKIEDESFDSG